MKDRIVIATRESKLALWQSNWVKERIEKRFPEITVELLRMKTRGDKILDTPLAKIGGKGLFVKELETAIINKEADIAVHSMKDVPVELPEELEISVITERENPSDAFVSNHYRTFDSLPPNAVIGTSSLRRIAQLGHVRPDIRFQSLRGNVNTRLKKLDDGLYDAIVLASAGLIRLGQENRISEMIPHQISIPAIGQGVVAIESRKHDQQVYDVISPLNHQATVYQVEAERALLSRLNGGCQVPLAGHAVLDENGLTMSAMIANPDGSGYIKRGDSGPLDEAVEIGTRLAEELLKAGGRQILNNLGIVVE